VEEKLMDSQFLLTFDTNPIILNRVKETLRADPLVVRYDLLLVLEAIADPVDGRYSRRVLLCESSALAVRDGADYVAKT
jgi:hypothetical protein